MVVGPEQNWLDFFYKLTNFANVFLPGLSPKEFYVYI